MSFFQSAMAENVNVVGQVYVSSLPDNASVTLTGGCKLIIDQNKRLKNINGNYALTIQGQENYTLTMVNSGRVIKVANLTIQSVTLVVTGGNDTAIYGQSGSVSIFDSKVVVNAVTGIWAKNNITIDNTSEVILKAGLCALKAEGGSAYIDGKITIMSTDGDGINADKNIVIKSDTMNIDVDGNAIYARHGNISINDQSVNVEAYGYRAIYAPEGDIYLNGTIKAKSGNETAIKTNKGKVTIDGDVTVSQGASGIFSCTDMIINGSASVYSNLLALYCTEGSIIINGNINITSKDSDGINADKDVSINSGTMNIDVGRDAIYARHGNISINNQSVNVEAYGYRAIYAPEGDVYLNGTIKAKSGNETAIKTNRGKVTIDGDVTVSQGASGIFSCTDMIINGSASAYCNLLAFYCTEGSIIINGNVHAASNHNNAIEASQSVSINPGQGGWVIAQAPSGRFGIRASNGNVNINSGNIQSFAGTSIYARNAINIHGGHVIANSESKALDGTISITPPLSILAPANGVVSGKLIVDANGTTAKYVEIGIPPLSGTVSLDTTNPVVGSWVRYTLSGGVYTLYSNDVALTTQWQRSADGRTGWVDVEGNTDSNGRPVYIVTTSDLDKYLRVRITVQGYEGVLSSSARKVTKSNCPVAVEAPALTISSDQVRVSNPKSTQEYIILNDKKAVRNLTESDWTNSQTFDPTTQTMLFLGGTANATNYVYTRVKETETAYAGTDVRMASIYLGTTTYVQDIAMDFKRVETRGNNVLYYVDLEQDDLGAYYVQCGEVYRITVTPTPADATFNGIFGDKWLVAGYPRTSQYGMYYSDIECTNVINANTYYKTVYFKPQDGTMVNYKELRVEYTKSYNDVATDACQVNIATSLGFYKVDNLYSNSDLTIGKGESMEGLKFTIRPAKATIRNFTITQTGGEGTAPVISFDTDSQTYSINATEATSGTYYYSVSVNNGQASTTMTVNVTAPALEELRLLPSEVTLDPGATLELTPLLLPYGAEADFSWTSYDTSVATVTSDGVVTISEDADAAATATIRAVADGKTAFCNITVSGEKYDVWVAGTQVTSRNMNDVLGDGTVSFDGMQTLTLDNASIDVDSKAAQGATLGIEGMTLRLIGDNTITSNNYNGLKVCKTAIIEGDGTLTLTGGNCGIILDGNGSDYDICLTIANSATVIAQGGAYGIGTESNMKSGTLVVNGKETGLRAKGSTYSIYGLKSLTLEDGQEIVTPESGRYNPNMKYVVDSNSQPVQDEWVEIEVPLENYNLYVKGIRVTSRNKDRLGLLIAGNDEDLLEQYHSGSMNVWYDSDENILYLNNASIASTGSGTNDGIYVGISELTINIDGNCTVTNSGNNGIQFNQSGFISGDGNLSVSAANIGIYISNSSKTLEINGGIGLTTQGKYGICGFSASSYLVVSGGETEVRATGSTASIGNIRSLSLLDGLSIIEPAGAVFTDNYVKDAEGVNVTSEVVISTPVPYAVYDSSNTTLTFYHDGQRASHNSESEQVYDLNTEKQNPGWIQNNVNRNITKVVFDPSFADARPTTTYKWFYMVYWLNNITGLENLNTSEVTDMSYMFGSTELESLDLSTFDTSKVTDMSYMFGDNTGLTSVNVSSFDTRNVMYMEGMFYESSALTSLDLSNFNTQNVKSFKDMFFDCVGLTSLDLSNFDTREAETMNQMFIDCTYLTNLNLSGFNTGHVGDMSSMFSGCSSLTTLDLSSFDTSDLLLTNYMFGSCSNLMTIYVGDGWDEGGIEDSSDMFSGCSNIKGGKGTTYDANHLDAAYAHIDGGTENPGYFTGEIKPYVVYDSSTTTLTFYHDGQRASHNATAEKVYFLNQGSTVPAWYSDNSSASVTKVVFHESFADARPTSTANWFSEMFSLTSFEGLVYLNTSEVTSMKNMFSDCPAVSEVDFSNFDTSNVTDMSAMFSFCGAEELELSSFSTENVTNMTGMFALSSLKTIYVSDKWTTAAVTSSDMMFLGCSSLVGGMGTTYDAEHVDAAYAHIDGGASNPGYFTEKPAFLLGDVNGDGKVDVADITALTNYLIAYPQPLPEGMGDGYNLQAADVDGSGEVTSADVPALVNLILGQ